jgi:predicted dehydrogenase
MSEAQTPWGRPLTVAVLGAGTRGRLFAELLAELPHLAQVVAVAEPRAAYRDDFAARHGLPACQVFNTWQEFVSAPRLCDAVIVATMDRDHLGPALACLDKGYDMLLEKPMAPTLAECRVLDRAQRESGSLVAVCHSLRHQKGFAMVKALVAGGRLGRVMSVDQLEQVGFEHYAHSYIRGNWGNAGRATPMLLAKSCHDLDYLSHLVGAPATHVSSFGHLSHFRPEHAPEGSTARCTEGCRVEHSCPYSAIKQYVQADLTAWPAAVISPVHTPQAHFEAIRTGPYGRCVWRSDNDVVDHQVVAIQYANQVTATFTMTGFTQSQGRRLRVHGTAGELRFDEHANAITLKTFGDRNTERIDLGPEAGAHGGGDHRIVRAWLEALHRRDPAMILTDVQASLATHTIAFAAEASRLAGRTVALAEFAGGPLEEESR